VEKLAAIHAEERPDGGGEPRMRARSAAAHASACAALLSSIVPSMSMKTPANARPFHCSSPARSSVDRRPRRSTLRLGERRSRFVKGDLPDEAIFQTTQAAARHCVSGGVAAADAQLFDFFELDRFFAAVFFLGVLFLRAVVFFFDADFLLFDEDFFLLGTFPPAFRASDRPIAIACLRLVTFLPERPDLSVPSLRSCIAFLTLLDAFLPYRGMCCSSGGSPRRARARVVAARSVPANGARGNNARRI
jgi:hypothetical protein